MAGCTHPKYVAGCTPCRDRDRDRKRRERQRRRAGTGHPPVAAATIRDHIAKLRGAGMAYSLIATDSGIHEQTIRHIAHGATTRVQAATAAALLSVTPRPGRRVDNVPAAGTARRIRALCVLGWTMTEQASRTGTSRPALGAIARGRQLAVTPALAARVAAVYDELYALDPVDTQHVRLVRRQSRERGWHGPEAWSDATIDDPDAQPGIVLVDAVDEVAVQRAIDGDIATAANLTKAERIEAARRLVRRGAGPGAVSQRLRVSGKAARLLVGQARVLEGVAA